MFKTMCFNKACYIRKSVAATANSNVRGARNSLKLFDIPFFQCRQTALLVGIFRILIFLIGTIGISGKNLFLDMYDV